MRNRLYRADKAGSRGKEKSPCRNCPEAVYSKGFGVPEVIRTPDLPLRSMAYHVIHGSDVTSNIIPYAE